MLFMRLTTRSRSPDVKAALALLAGLLMPSSQAGAADTSQGAQLAAVCASCHGGPGGIPVIIGQDAGKISAAMLAYRTAERPNHIMHAIALSLSDEEIASVARYLAGQKAEPQ